MSEQSHKLRNIILIIVILAVLIPTGTIIFFQIKPLPIKDIEMEFVNDNIYTTPNSSVTLLCKINYSKYEHFTEFNVGYSINSTAESHMNFSPGDTPSLSRRGACQ